MLKFKLAYLFILVFCFPVMAQKTSKHDLYSLKNDESFTKNYHYELMGSPLKIEVIDSEKFSTDSLKIKFKAYLFRNNEWELISGGNQIDTIYSGYRIFFKFYKKSLLDFQFNENNLYEIIVDKNCSFLFIQNKHLYTKVKL